MGLSITSIGVKISYAVETTANTRPTTGYIHIPDLKDFPEIDSAPETTETTTFDNLYTTTYTDLLKDLGGAITITANFTIAMVKVWREMYDKYLEAKASGRRVWLAIDIPDFDEAGFLTVNPSIIGIPAIGFNSLIEKNVYVTPTGEPIWAAKPTYATI